MNNKTNNKINRIILSTLIYGSVLAVTANINAVKVATSITDAVGNIDTATLATGTTTGTTTGTAGDTTVLTSTTALATGDAVTAAPTGTGTGTATTGTAVATTPSEQMTAVKAAEIFTNEITKLTGVDKKAKLAKSSIGFLNANCAEDLKNMPRDDDNALTDNLIKLLETKFSTVLQSDDKTIITTFKTFGDVWTCLFAGNHLSDDMKNVKDFLLSKLPKPKNVAEKAKSKEYSAIEAMKLISGGRVVSSDDIANAKQGDIVYSSTDAGFAKWTRENKALSITLSILSLGIFYLAAAISQSKEKNQMTNNITEAYLSHKIAEHETIKYCLDFISGGKLAEIMKATNAKIKCDEGQKEFAKLDKNTNTLTLGVSRKEADVARKLLKITFGQVCNSIFTSKNKIIENAADAAVAEVSGHDGSGRGPIVSGRDGSGRGPIVSGRDGRGRESGSGNGRGSGSGNGNGRGSGNGNGRGSGNGNGRGSGNGNGRGSGNGNGRGSGSGNGNGRESGNGNGRGSGSGNGNGRESGSGNVVSVAHITAVDKEESEVICAEWLNKVKGIEKSIFYLKVAELETSETGKKEYIEAVRTTKNRTVERYNSALKRAINGIALLTIEELQRNERISAEEVFYASLIRGAEEEERKEVDYVSKLSDDEFERMLLQDKNNLATLKENLKAELIALSDLLREENQKQEKNHGGNTIITTIAQYYFNIVYIGTESKVETIRIKSVNGELVLSDQEDKKIEFKYTDFSHADYNILRCDSSGNIETNMPIQLSDDNECEELLKDDDGCEELLKDDDGCEESSKDDNLTQPIFTIVNDNIVQICDEYGKRYEYGSYSKEGGCGYNLLLKPSNANSKTKNGDANPGAPLICGNGDQRFKSLPSNCASIGQYDLQGASRGNGDGESSLWPYNLLTPPPFTADEDGKATASADQGRKSER